MIGVLMLIFLSVSEEDFVRGADVSMLLEIERAGGVFAAGGRPGDALKILREGGVNFFRLRLFVNPDPDYARSDGATQDLGAVRTLARRIKALGAGWLLDLHYSDTWADPSRQETPAAWKGLGPDALEKRVEEYTAGVLEELRRESLTPDWVQVGNEVTAGFLWPEGRLAGGAGETASWDRFTRLLKAGIRGARRSAGGVPPRIMVHIDRGGDAGAVRWFFGRLRERGVGYDLIGLSYYPWWHGPLEDLRRALEAAAAFGRDVVVVETAYPHRGDWKQRKNMDWPATPEGQGRFLADVLRTVRGIPGGRGRGVVYWYPEAVPVRGRRIWNGGSTALFGPEGEALPALGILGRG